MNKKQIAETVFAWLVANCERPTQADLKHYTRLTTKLKPTKPEQILHYLNNEPSI